MGNGVAVAEAHGPRAERRTVGRPRVAEGVVRAFLAGCGVFVVATTLAILAFLAQTGVRGAAAVGLGQLLGGAVWKPEADVFSSARRENGVNMVSNPSIHGERGLSSP